MQPLRKKHFTVIFKQAPSYFLKVFQLVGYILPNSFYTLRQMMKILCWQYYRDNIVYFNIFFNYCTALLYQVYYGTYSKKSNHNLKTNICKSYNTGLPDIYARCRAQGRVHIYHEYLCYN